MIYSDEIWKPIKGFEEEYEISNYGRLKSYVKCNAHPKVPRILNPYSTRQGYLKIDLKNKYIKKRYLVHRLVAEAFIPNLENKPYINHIDGNKKNNCVENLEWCTPSENMYHAFKTGLKKSKYGKDNPKHVKVNQYDLKGNFIKCWYGFHEIDRILGFDYRNIFACCNNKQPTAYGYIWRYADEE